MVAFQKMWEDVGQLLNNEDLIQNIKFVEKNNNTFIVNENGEPLFITKEDFVDFWCRMLYFNQVSKEQIIKDCNNNMKYVYEIIKILPYIKEDCGVLTIKQEQ